MYSWWNEVLVCVVEFDSFENVSDHDADILEDGIFVIVFEGSEEFVLSSGVTSF